MKKKSKPKLPKPRAILPPNKVVPSKRDYTRKIKHKGSDSSEFSTKEM